MLTYLQPIHNIEKTIKLYNVENLHTHTGPTLYSRFCSRAKGSPFPSQQLRSSHGSKVDGARLEPWLFLCTQPLLNLYLALTSDFVLYFTKHITNIMTLYYMFISWLYCTKHSLTSLCALKAPRHKLPGLGSCFSFLIKTHKMLFEKHMWHYSTEVLLSSQNWYIYMGMSINITSQRDLQMTWNLST